MKSKVIIALILLLVICQFIPMDKSNPPIDPSADLLSSATLNGSDLSLLRAACMDCHSNETVYPAYAKFQPVGWLLRSHVRGGRMKLNFSEWNNYDPEMKNHKLIECEEVLEQKRMPLKSYTWLHPESKLTDTKREELVALFQKMKN